MIFLTRRLHGLALIVDGLGIFLLGIRFRLSMRTARRIARLNYQQLQPKEESV